LDRIMQKEKWDTRLIGQIHDSIIMDVHPAELPHVIETAKRVAGTDLRNTWPWIIVPLDIDIEYCPIDGNWSEKVKL